MLKAPSRELAGRLESGGIESIECPLRENSALFKFGVEFTRNPVSIYDVTIFRLQATPVVPLYIQSIAIEFSEARLNKELLVQTAVVPNTVYSYEASLYIEPTVPSAVQLKSILLVAKLSA